MSADPRVATARQEAWLKAADRAGDDLVSGLFRLIALPNERERDTIREAERRGLTVEVIRAR